MIYKIEKKLSYSKNLVFNIKDNQKRAKIRCFFWNIIILQKNCKK